MPPPNLVCKDALLLDLSYDLGKKVMKKSVFFFFFISSINSENLIPDNIQGHIIFVTLCLYRSDFYC